MKKVIYVFFARALLAGCKGRSAKTAEAEAVETEPTDTLAAVKAAQALPEEPIFDIVTNYGTIRVKLFKGTVTVVGRKSPYSLYDEGLATYAKGDEFDHKSAVGFIYCWGLPGKTAAKAHMKADKKKTPAKKAAAAKKAPAKTATKKK